MAGATADLEQRARTVEVDAHPEVEIRLGLAADDGGQMEDGGGLRRNEPLEQRAVGDVAGHLGDARIVEAFRRDDVGQRDLVEPFVPAVSADEMSALEQPGCEGLAEETGAAGDQLRASGAGSYRKSRARGFAGSGSGGSGLAGPRYQSSNAGFSVQAWSLASSISRGA